MPGADIDKVRIVIANAQQARAAYKTSISQRITDEGNLLVEEHQYKELKEGLFTYDLSYRPAQRYYLKVFVKGELKYNKRIRVVEKQNNFR